MTEQEIKIRDAMVADHELLMNNTGYPGVVYCYFPAFGEEESSFTVSDTADDTEISERATKMKRALVERLVRAGKPIPDADG